jgi:hypothetical protein
MASPHTRKRTYSCSVSFAYWTRLLVPSETGACLSLRKQKRQSNETDSIDDYEFLTTDAQCM